MLLSEELAGQLSGLPSRSTYLKMTGQVLMRLIPCDLVGWNAIDPASGRAEIASWPSEALDHDAGPEVMASLDDHPIVLSYAKEPPRAALPAPRRLSELVTQLELRRTKAYSLIYGPMRVADQLAVTTGVGGTMAQRGWALNRGNGSFSDSDASLLRQLQPLLLLLDIAYSGEMAPVGENVADRFGLTAREREVLDLCRRGMTSAAIAQVLGIRPATVAKHLERTYSKLGVSGRIAALARLDGLD